MIKKFGKWTSKLHSLMDLLYMMQPEGFVNPKGVKQNVQAPAIHLWTGASISELEYTL